MIIIWNELVHVRRFEFLRDTNYPLSIDCDLARVISRPNSKISAGRSPLVVAVVAAVVTAVITAVVADIVTTVIAAVVAATVATLMAATVATLMAAVMLRAAC